MAGKVKMHTDTYTDVMVWFYGGSLVHGQSVGGKVSVCKLCERTLRNPSF